MNILVTGGAGYIGSMLVPLLLSEGHRLRVLDSLLHGGEPLLGVWCHPGFEFIHGDICDPGKLKSSLALIEESRRAGVSRFVFASTCSNYGKMKDPNACVNEESELRPVSLYAETKVAVEKTLLQGGGDSSWCATPLRFATIFGVSPRMRFDLTVNEFTME